MSVLSRLINVRAYEETRTVILEEEQFWKIAESQLQFVREKENCLINDKILQQIGVADKVSFEEWVKIC
jgi:hypothetical protein